MTAIDAATVRRPAIRIPLPRGSLTRLGRKWNGRSNFFYSSRARIRFPITIVFNAAAYFIDRHLEEGRAAKIAIECEDRRVSYGSLFEHVNRTGSALRVLGVRPEERILLLMLDGPEMVFAFFGAIKIGAVPIPTNTLWTASDYEFLLQDSRAAVVIVSAALHPRIAEVVPRCPWVRQVIVAGGPSPNGTIDFDSMVGRASPELVIEPTSNDSPAFWLYSSGSTGRPKACVHLQHDMT